MKQQNSHAGVGIFRFFIALLMFLVIYGIWDLAFFSQGFDGGSELLQLRGQCFILLF